MLQNFGRIKEKLLFAVPLRSSERKHNFIRVSRSPQMAYRLDFSQRDFLGNKESSINENIRFHENREILLKSHFNVTHVQILVEILHCFLKTTILRLYSRNNFVHTP